MDLTELVMRAQDEGRIGILVDRDEIRVTCPECGTENVFPVDKDE